MAEAAPVLKPLKVGAGFAEEFKLHLLKLAHAENKVAGGNLVPEALADLADTERQLFARGALYVVEVDENALRGFGAEVHRVFGILCHALEGLEHQVELADVRKVMLAAGRARDVVLLHEILHFGLREGVDGLGESEAGLRAPVLDYLVGAETLVAFAAVHQGIRESAQVTGRHPCLRVHENRGVQSDVVGILLHELFPPCALDVVFQLHAEGTVVPRVGKSAVYFRAGENEAPRLAQRDDLVHCLSRIVHLNQPTFPGGDWLPPPFLIA